MNRVTTFILMVLFSMVMAVSCFAQQNSNQQQDMSRLTPEERVQLMALQDKMNQQRADERMEAAEKWIGIGERFGEKLGKIIGDVCKELGIQANEFIKTPAGKLTVGLIVWKVIGEDLWDIVGGTLAWLCITSILFVSFRHFHMNERTVNKESAEVKYISRYDFEDQNYETGSAWAHGIGFLLTTAVCLLIVF
jgi:hypothetical protein